MAEMGELLACVDACVRNGDVAQAERLLLDACDAALLGGQADLSHAVTILNELGTLYRENGRLAESVDYFDRAADALVQAREGALGDEYAVIRINQAGAFRLMRRYEEAFGHYADAADVLRRLHREHTYEYASLLNNTAMTLLDMGRRDDALARASEAYEIVADLFPGGWEEAVSQGNLAAVALQAGETSRAEELVEQACVTFEEKFPDDGHYPAILHTRAVLALKRGDMEVAVESADHAVRLLERSRKGTPQHAAALNTLAAARSAAARDAGEGEVR